MIQIKFQLLRMVLVQGAPILSFGYETISPRLDGKDLFENIIIKRK
jgi:hypothetical protein